MNYIVKNSIVAVLGMATSFFGLTQQHFPHEYFGVYRGDLLIETLGSIKRSIPMEIHLLPADTSGRYNFQMYYDVGENQSVRNYHLLAVDMNKGIFLIDENNGILMDASVAQNCLYSSFQVEGSLLQVRECFYKKHMEYELLVIDGTQERITFSDPEEIQVRSYPIISRQSARLKRYKK
jgi:hypothetical protein